jgi:CRP-like cAMP-binding protein
MAFNNAPTLPPPGGNGTHDTDSNRILSALPAEEYERLRPNLERVEMRLGEVLQRPDEPHAFVYFPLSGTISVTAEMSDGAEAEVGMVGREGVLGLPVALGTRSSPLKAFTQVPGAGVRLRAGLFTEEFDRRGELHCLVLRYAQAFFVQTALTAACNRLHTLDQRLANWLLRSRDRARSDELPLTHEFLSVMLGIRRAGVTEALGRLRDAGIVGRGRGRAHIVIADAAGLERAACECYGVLRAEFDRLLGAESRLSDRAAHRSAPGRVAIGGSMEP